MSDAFRTHDGRTLQQAASDLVQREVLCCMSSMVATLAAPFDLDHINEGLDELHEQAQELAAPVLDYEGAAREAGWVFVKDAGTWKRHDPRPDSDHWIIRAATAEHACEHDNIEPHELEVFEHWAVTTWFAEKLTAASERVDTDFAGLNVWARTTTGQAIHADAVVEQITREMHEAHA